MGQRESEIHSISLQGREIRFTLRKSARARRLKLQIGMNSGLEVVVPQRARVSDSQIEKFIQEKQAWILRHLSKLEKIASESDSRKEFLLFLGKEARIEILESDRKTARALASEGKLTVKVPVGKKRLAGKAIIAFYKKQAREIIPKIVKEKAGLMGASFSRISIRDQKTRWGSCSSRGTLSFSWRILAAPRSIIEYLVVHELAHLKHRNHSKSFWRAVAEYCPDYKDHERWLRKNKHLLRARTSF